MSRRYVQVAIMLDDVQVGDWRGPVPRAGEIVRTVVEGEAAASPYDLVLMVQSVRWETIVTLRDSHPKTLSRVVAFVDCVKAEDFPPFQVHIYPDPLYSMEEATTPVESWPAVVIPRVGELIRLQNYSPQIVSRVTRVEWVGYGEGCRDVAVYCDHRAAWPEGMVR